MATDTKSPKAPKAPKATPAKPAKAPLKTVAEATANGEVGHSQLPRLRGYNVTPGERWADFEAKGKITIDLTALVDRLHEDGTLRKAGLSANKAERRALALRYAAMQQIGWSRMGAARLSPVSTVVERDPSGPVTLTVVFRGE